MRKVLSVLFVTAAMFMFISACNEKNEVEIPAKLEISEESLLFYEHGINFCASSLEGLLTAKISFTSSISWSVKIEDANDGKPITWLTVSPTSGSAGQTSITITAQNNVDEEARKAKVTITCGSISQSFNVVQLGRKAPGGLTVNPPQVTLVKEEKVQLTAYDSDGKPVKATWGSDDDKIAVVDQNGQVEGRNPGSAIITAKVDGKTGTCLVTVEDEIAVQSLTFDKTELTLNVGETYTLTPIFTPENATNKTIYRWSSTGTQIATVDDNGQVKAVAPGKCWIKAGLNAQGTIMAQCEVTVVDPNAVTIESVTLDITQSTITIGQAEPLILTATVTPQNALDKVSIEWKSSKPTAVVVEAINKTQAKVTGLLAGTETVTAKIGSKTATCQVTVN